MGASVERAMALFLERCVKFISYAHAIRRHACLRLLGAIYVFVRLRSLVSRKDPCKSRSSLDRSAPATTLSSLSRALVLVVTAHPFPNSQ